MDQTLLQAMAKPDCDGYIVLGFKDGAPIQSEVEHSFSLGLSTKRTRFYWTGKAFGNFMLPYLNEETGEIDWKVPAYNLDGLQTTVEIRQRLSEQHPDYEWKIFNVHAPNLPVLIDWDQWRVDSARSDKMLSGVVNKSGCRNPRFYVRETENHG